MEDLQKLIKEQSNNNLPIATIITLITIIGVLLLSYVLNKIVKRIDNLEINLFNTKKKIRYCQEYYQQEENLLLEYPNLQNDSLLPKDHQQMDKIELNSQNDIENQILIQNYNGNIKRPDDEKKQLIITIASLQNQNKDLSQEIQRNKEYAHLEIEKLQKKIRYIDNQNNNFKRFSMIQKINQIKISVQNYEAKYEEDYKLFDQNYRDHYRSDQMKQQQVRQILKQLYEDTNKQRQVEEQYKYYVRERQDSEQLKINYNLSLQANQAIKQHCNAFREVRGDGNCFYTAFGYQFLYILLFHYSFDKFFEFIQKIKEIELPMKLVVQEDKYKIEGKEIEQQLLQEFLYRLIKLKLIKDINQRQESFFKQFATHKYESDEVDSCLYGLSTIFFRNYSDYSIEVSDKKDFIYDKENLLKWEVECNSNETVIAELAKNLNLFVELIFFDNQQFQIHSYGNKENDKIILLMKPGHYNIGLFSEETKSERLIKINRSLEEELINQNKEDQQSQEQESSIQLVRNLQDKFQKGQLAEIEVWKLKEGLLEQHQLKQQY